MTAAELRKAQARYQRASASCVAVAEARNVAVRAALAEGWTHAQIAEATGLTRGRIGQIAATKTQQPGEQKPRRRAEAAPQARETKPGNSETQ